MTQPDQKAIIEFVRIEASLGTRVRYVALLLASVGMMAIIGTLLATEVDLPSRARLAFGAMIAISAAWAGLAGWVLTRRRPLFAQDRVIAGWIAVAASFGFGGIAIAITISRSPDFSLWSGLMTLTILGLAALRLRSARRWKASLHERLAQLETSQ